MRSVISEFSSVWVCVLIAVGGNIHRFLRLHFNELIGINFVSPVPQ